MDDRKGTDEAKVNLAGAVWEDLASREDRPTIGLA